MTQRRSALVISLLVLFPVLANSARGFDDIFYVDDCTGTGSGTQADPFCRIQDAIDAAPFRDTVILLDGEYKGEGNRDLHFNAEGKPRILKSSGGAANCIINCEGSPQTPRRAFLFDHGNLFQTALEGVTIKNGYDNLQGGAIMVTNDTRVTIRDCVFADNQGSGGGGAIATMNSSPMIMGCTFTGNHSNGQGGAIRCGYEPGGARNLTVIDRSVIHGNSSSSEAGGIFTQGGVIIPGVWSTNVTVSNCTITGNSSVGAGGGMTAEGNPIIINSTIAGNITGGYGGGIYSCESDRTILNCRITDNIAGHQGGGVMFNADSSPANRFTMRNTLVANNAALRGEPGDIGGFLRVGGSSGGPGMIENCIFWNNNPLIPGGEIHHDFEAPLTVSFCRIRASAAGILAPAEYLTYTESTGDDPGFVDPPIDDYRLAAGSLAIDAANNSPIEGVATDLDGSERFVDDPQTADSGLLSSGRDCAVADIGPYEYQAPAAAPLAESGGVPRNRHLALSDANDDLTAIRVKLIDLQNPNPPNSPQNPPPDFSEFESGSTCTDPGGCVRWVGPPLTVLEFQDNPGAGSYKAARLQCTPYYHAWSNEGLVHITGSEIVPSSTYQVQTLRQPCDESLIAESAFSAPLTTTTARWGDVLAEYPTTPGSQVTALDVAAVIAKFKSLPGAIKRAQAQIQPNVPELNSDVSSLDILGVVDAFKGIAYPFHGPCPCPSTVTCDVTACSNSTPCGGGTCVKTCIDGIYVGLPCINNTHCPGGACGTGFCRDRCGRCSP